MLSNNWAVCSSWLRLQFAISPAPTNTTLPGDVGSTVGVCVAVEDGEGVVMGVEVCVAVGGPAARVMTN
jgi:hypothetical protein